MKPDDKGNVEYVICAVEDITERKQVEQALQESEMFTSSLLSNSPHPILVINPDTSIRYMNHAMEGLTGFSSVEVIGKKSPYPWWTEETIEKTSEDLKQAMHSGAKRLEELFQKNSGERFWVEITSEPIKEDGELKYYVANWLDITERKQVEEELKRSRQELSDLAAHLQSVREGERTGIARELHDELGQALTALKMDLSWLNKRLPKDEIALFDKVKSMLDLTDITIQTVKRISSELRPGILDDLGLAAAIEWQAEEFQKRTGVECELTITEKAAVLDQDCSTAIFRIFQEIMNNIARHAQATMVKASLTEKAGNFILEVTDNGKGITKKQISNPKSFGLAGMRERAHSLQGEIRIEGIHNQGTTITVRIPLRKEETQ